MNFKIIWTRKAQETFNDNIYYLEQDWDKQTQHLACAIRLDNNAHGFSPGTPNRNKRPGLSGCLSYVSSHPVRWLMFQ